MLMLLRRWESGPNLDLRVIAKKAGKVVHILDRCHIVAHLSKAIDEVRAQEGRN
jgi:transposase